MLIVACQICDESKVIAGTPDVDGMARATWICPCCGAGQVVQLPVSADARKMDLRKIVCGMALAGGSSQSGEK